MSIRSNSLPYGKRKMLFRYCLILLISLALLSTYDRASAQESPPLNRLGPSNNDAAILNQVIKSYRLQIQEGKEAWEKAGWEAVDFSKLPKTVDLELPQAAGKLSVAELRDATLILGVELPDGQFSVGGAVMISPNGLALTNYHIAATFNNKVIGMTTTGRTVKMIKVLAGNRTSDVAIVQLEGEGFPWIPVASEAPKVADGVVMMHHTENRFFTYDQGYVKRYPIVGATPWMEVSADYGQGGSGCGIFNNNHELVGLAALITIGDGPMISRQEAFPPEQEDHVQRSVDQKPKSADELLSEAPASPHSPPPPGALVVKFAVPLTAIQSLVSPVGTDGESETDGLQSQPSLRVGSKAPSLQGAKWLQGEPIKEFQGGKVYVVEFWATWCGPCIKAMPHLNELRKTYKDQGLTIVAMTTADRRNPVDRIEQFVNDRGKEFGFGFAMCETDSVNLAYMKAANRNSIPASFVIDQEGKVAFIGHPKDLDVVLKKIFNGTWKGEESAQELDALEGRFADLRTRVENEPEEVLSQLAAIEKKFPHVSKTPSFHLDRIVGLAKIGREEELMVRFQTAFELIKEEKNAISMVMLGACLSDPQTNPKRICLSEGGRAIEAALAMETADDIVIFLAAQAYVASGEHEKGIQLMDRAIEQVGDSPEKQFLETIKERLKEAVKKKDRDPN